MEHHQSVTGDQQQRAWRVVLEAHATGSIQPGGPLGRCPVRRNLQEARLQRPAQRTARKPFHRGSFEATVSDVQTALKRIGGTCSDVVDGAAGGVLAEQDALRTLQHFHTLHIQRGKSSESGKRQRHLIDVHSDVWVCGQRGFVESHAAQRVYGRRVPALCERETGHDRREPGDRADVLIAQLVAAHGGDREADLADRLLAFLRGDDDLLQSAGFRGFAFGGCGRRVRGGHGQRRQASGQSHAFPLSTVLILHTVRPLFFDP